MKKLHPSRCVLFLVALALVPLFQGQVSDQQRKQLRELLRYQRAYNEQLDQARKQLLEKDEELQLVYSEMIDAERVYLEVTKQYETLLEKKLKANPTVKDIQAKLGKINEQIRSVGTAPKSPRR
jgi:type II secretory pathway pseudopilin PulG